MASLNQAISSTLSVVSSSFNAVTTAAESLNDVMQVARTCSSSWRERTVTLEKGRNAVKMLETKNQIEKSYAQALREQSQTRNEFKDVLTDKALDSLWK